MTVRLEQRTTTGAFCTTETFLFTATLSAELGNGNAEFRNGAGGSIRLTLNCGNHSTVVWRCGSPAGVQFSNGIHVTVTGSAGDAAVSVSYEQPSYS